MGYDYVIVVWGLYHGCVQEDNYGAIFLALDKFFLTVFVLEILVKWYSDFFGFWTTGWNIFDFVIVAASILGPSELCVSQISPASQYVCIARGDIITVYSSFMDNLVFAKGYLITPITQRLTI